MWWSTFSSAAFWWSSDQEDSTAVYSRRAEWSSRRGVRGPAADPDRVHLQYRERLTIQPCAMRGRHLRRHFVIVIGDAPVVPDASAPVAAMPLQSSSLWTNSVMSHNMVLGYEHISRGRLCVGLQRFHPLRKIKLPGCELLSHVLLAAVPSPREALPFSLVQD